MVRRAIAKTDARIFMVEEGRVKGECTRRQRTSDLRYTDRAGRLPLLNAMGLTTISGGVFHLTVRAREHLTKGSPWDLTPYYASMKDRPQTLDMLKVLRTGKPANWGSYDPQAWAQAMEREDFAGPFT